MTSSTLASLRLADDESLKKFMDKFGHTAVQIQNLNPEVALYSMFLALQPNKFEYNMCKKSSNSMEELREWAKCYIQMEEISRFSNEVRQVGQKRDKREGNTKIDLHKPGKRHKPDKRQLLPKGSMYERYTPLMANHTIILEEAFNLEVPIRLPLMKPPRSGLDAKYQLPDQEATMLHKLATCPWISFQ